MKEYNLAILGATGAVGQEFINLLNERDFPFKNLKLLASARSAGKELTVRGKTYKVEEAKADSFNGVDVALFAGGSISKTFAPIAVKAGAVVIDNSSTYRMDPDVPLIVPEVNPQDITKHHGIIANPNCSTIITVTAIAALNIEGATIHSMFTLPLSDFLIPQEVRSPRRRKLKSILKKTDILIIDEVSMLRPDILDMIEELCCQARGNLALFGGLQIILIGDLCQLPPIIKPAAIPAFKQKYGTAEPYFFDALSYQKGAFEKIELTEVYRQSDKELLSYLQNLRNDENLPETVSYFNRRENYPPDFAATAITITPYRSVADGINRRRLAELQTPEREYEAQLAGSFEKMQDTPSPKILTIKEGALVVFNKNNYPDYINGTSGIVEKLEDRYIVVRCLQDNKFITVRREEWKSFAYDINEETGDVTEKETGSFIQFPLQLGYALTIHKAQGKTLDRVIIDIDRGAFAHGQLYVALSRTRRKADMLIKRGLCEDDIIFSDRIKSFLS